MKPKYIVKHPRFSPRAANQRVANPLPLLVTCGMALLSGVSFGDDLLKWNLPVSTGGSSSGTVPIGAVGFSGTVITAQAGTKTGDSDPSYWQRNDFSALDLSAAQTANQYYSFSTTAASDFTVTISGMGPSIMRTGSLGPTVVGLFHSSDNTTFTQMGGNVTISSGTDTDIGAAFGTALSANPVVQTSGQTHYWRVVAAGGTSTTTAGRVRWKASSTVDFSMTGTSVSNFSIHDLVWTGAGGSDWNTAPANKNWSDTGNGNSAAAFAAHDNVTIGIPAAIMVDAGGVQPGTVKVSNTTGTVAFSGGSITGYSLEKTGAGTATIGGTNGFAAGVAVREGVLQTDGNAALGTFPITLDGGTLATTANTTAVSNSFILGASSSTLQTADATNFSGVFSAVNGAINVANVLTKTGPGVLTISNTGSSAFGTQTTVGSAAGMIELDVPEGGLVFSGSGTRNLGGTNNWDAPVTLSGGLLQLHGGSIQGTGSIAVAATSTIRSRLNFGTATVVSPLQLATGVILKVDSANGGNRLEIQSVISGDGSLDKIGNGEVTLKNANLYIGGTLVEAGKLSITNVAALGPNPVTVNGGQLQIEQTAGTIANDLTLTGTTAGVGNLGKGALLFHNDNLQSILSGTVTLAGETTIRSYSSGSVSVFEKPIVGVGPLIFEAGGALTKHNQTWRLGGSASTFIGDVTLRSDGSANAILVLDGGSLPVTASLTMKDSSTVGGNNAVLDLNGQAQTLAGLSNIAGANGLGTFITNGGAASASLTIDSAADTEFSGVIGTNTAAAATNQSPGGDDISLVKKGAGRLTLSGPNTYSGNTSVLGGTLAVTTPNFGDSSTVTLDGGTLELGGGPDVVGALVINGVAKAGNGAVYNSANTGGAIASGSLQVGAVAGSYLAWVTGPPYNLSGNAALPTADPDNDGISNAIEFVIGGNPASVSDLGKLPTLDASGANLVFTFRRSDLSNYLNPTVQYGSTLTGWTTAANGVDGVTIGAPTDLGGGVKQIVVTIPKSGESKRFARLNVVVP